MRNARGVHRDESATELIEISVEPAPALSLSRREICKALGSGALFSIFTNPIAAEAHVPESSVKLHSVACFGGQCDHSPDRQSGMRSGNSNDAHSGGC